MIAAFVILALALVVAHLIAQRASDRERQDLIAGHRLEMVRLERVHAAREAELVRHADRLAHDALIERRDLIERIQSPDIVRAAAFDALMPRREAEATTDTYDEPVLKDGDLQLGDLLDRSF